MSERYYKTPYNASSNAGRWNPRGTSMIYTGSSPTVAQLEYLCIMGNVVVARAWYMVVYNIADESLIGTLDIRSLPADWNVLPHGKATQDFGRFWLNDEEYPFLKVPSARIDLAFYPLEHNVLINPGFPDITNKLKVVETIPFTYQLNPWTS
jgi:RES domain-containing protein